VAKMKSVLQLAQTLETMKSSKAEIGKAAAANKMKGYIARAPAALAAVSGKLLSTELLKKLTMDDIRGLMLTELYVGESDVPTTGTKAKLMATFLELAASKQWTPPPRQGNADSNGSEVGSPRSHTARRRSSAVDQIGDEEGSGAVCQIDAEEGSSSIQIESDGDSSKNTDSDDDEDNTPEDPPGAYVGMEVRKYFEEDDTIHVGHVKETDVDEKNNLPMFLVEFDDGDQEDMHWSELRPLLHVTTVHPDSEDDEVCLPTHVHVCICACV